MAGYDYSQGMSNNAVAAYDDGLVPVAFGLLWLLGLHSDWR